MNRFSLCTRPPFHPDGREEIYVAQTSAWSFCPRWNFGAMRAANPRHAIGSYMQTRRVQDMRLFEAFMGRQRVPEGDRADVVRAAFLHTDSGMATKHGWALGNPADPFYRAFVLDQAERVVNTGSAYPYTVYDPAPVNALLLDECYYFTDRSDPDGIRDTDAPDDYDELCGALVADIQNTINGLAVPNYGSMGPFQWLPPTGLRACMVQDVGMYRPSAREAIEAALSDAAPGKLFFFGVACEHPRDAEPWMRFAEGLPANTIWQFNTARDGAGPIWRWEL